MPGFWNGINAVVNEQVLNLMIHNNDGRSAALSLVASTLGYCLLPMVGLSAVGIVFSLR